MTLPNPQRATSMLAKRKPHLIMEDRHEEQPERTTTDRPSVKHCEHHRCGPGRPLEPLLHRGFGRNHSQRRSDADNTRSVGGVLREDPVQQNRDRGWNAFSLGKPVAAEAGPRGHRSQRQAQVRLIYESNHKNDRVDARMLAKLGRADVSLLTPGTAS